MSDLDDTDRRILALLAADARRPYSDIADAVGLSAPAVSDRITKLQDAGVLRRFTIDLDRSRLRDGTHVLVSFAVHPGRQDDVRAAVAAADAVEHVFVTAAGDVTCSARLPVADVSEWVADTVDFEAITDYEVTALAAASWEPTAGSADLALACDECGNTVTSEGTTATIDGDRHHFCCQSCERQFRQRYERLDADA
ncbi:AsnC family transcriptional regulator [Halobacterium salinarum]|nr:AsnC family transcriptional regulator [Halobacterium salinarum]MBB6090241.1 DNA-binding Lrp family transcriptional regulator [Halobacterium salinarum]MDL0119037.1 AsnC family transcriptional regulator [Halobacterium salinarum]MDL0129801.1 AsnC family transcriptional regulator [Halobacterium salinarum]MDL0133381.1 AsnC family transcriptional regulator [Halobacterium salinarum]MDL0141775.1 AsnC family transcriptional regulator [Halobacterium salinarum]